MRSRGVETSGHSILTVDIIVSGGFAVVQPGSKMSINAVEGFPLEDFSSEVCSYFATYRNAYILTTVGGEESDCRGTEDRWRQW